MSVTVLVPKYAHRAVGADERAARSISDLMNPAETPANKCGTCGASGTSAAPLMAKPTFTMPGTLRPRGTLYTVFCSRCWLAEIRSK